MRGFILRLLRVRVDRDPEVRSAALVRVHEDPAILPTNGGLDQRHQPGLLGRRVHPRQQCGRRGRAVRGLDAGPRQDEHLAERATGDSGLSEARPAAVARGGAHVGRRALSGRERRAVQFDDELRPAPLDGHGPPRHDVEVVAEDGRLPVEHRRRIRLRRSRNGRRPHRVRSTHPQSKRRRAREHVDVAILDDRIGRQRAQRALPRPDGPRRFRRDIDRESLQPIGRRAREDESRSDDGCRRRLLRNVALRDDHATGLEVKHVESVLEGHEDELLPNERLARNRAVLRLVTPRALERASWHRRRAGARARRASVGHRPTVDRSLVGPLPLHQIVRRGRRRTRSRAHREGEDQPTSGR